MLHICWLNLKILVILLSVLKKTVWIYKNKSKLIERTKLHLRHDMSGLWTKHCWLLELISDIRRIFEHFSSRFDLELCSFFSSPFSVVSFFVSVPFASSVTILNLDWTTYNENVVLLPSIHSLIQEAQT